MSKSAWMLIPVGMLIAACASPVQVTMPATPTPPPPATATSVPTNVVTHPGSTASPQDACLIAQAPGPGDEPPRDSSDLMDNSDLGGGRWRLCTDAALVESSAWCEWDAPRTQVVEVSGLPQQAVEIAYDTSLSFARAQLQLSVTDWAGGHGGLVFTYGGPFDLRAAALDSDGLGGVVSFTVALTMDPETGPAVGVPTMYDGLIRWRCGGAPTP